MSDTLHICDNFEICDNFGISDDFGIILQAQNINLDAYFGKKTIYIEPIRYHKQSVPTDIAPVDSSMYIKKAKNSENALRFKLSSSAFDSCFNSKKVISIDLIKNYDNSVDFVIKFDGKDKEKYKKCITKRIQKNPTKNRHLDHN